MIVTGCESRNGSAFSGADVASGCGAGRSTGEPAATQAAWTAQETDSDPWWETRTSSPNASENGNGAQLWTCGVASGQDWSVAGDGTIRSMGKCLDVDAQGAANFTPVQLWECNGSGAQQWTPQDDGSLLNP